MKGKFQGEKMKSYLFGNSAILVVTSALFFSCSSTDQVQKKVERMDPSQQVDLSGKWNDTDSRLVADELIGDALSSNWLDESDYKDKKPVVTTGKVVNKTSEHIDVSVFLKDLQRAVINSGKAKYIASKDKREELRDERRDQQQYAKEETVKQMAAETGADIMLQGQITSVIDQADGQKLVYYQVDLEAVNLESGEIVWQGQKKIKKLTNQDKWKM